MSYPGNPEIPSDIQQRLLDAFGEALDLAEMGKREEASLGCDFILRTDPTFEPARVLMRRVADADGAISVDDLRGADALSEMLMPQGDPGFQDPGGNLRARIMAALAQRRLDDAVNLGMEHAAEIAEDADLLHRLQEAQTRLEARPYIQQFLESARTATANGDLLERDRWLGKIRALDPENPALAEFYDAAPTVSTTGLFQPIGGFDFAPMLPPDDPPAPTPAPPTRQESLSRFAHALEHEEPVSPSSVELQSMNTSSGTPVFSKPLEMSGIGTSLEELAGFGPASRSQGSASAPATGEEDRIQALLDEGQAAFERGELQSAIDAWSRIFLIDIDHAEANKRIEEARRVKAEADRRTEEMFHEGVTKFEAGDAVGARQIFERLLQIQPSYLAAREFIAQIDSGSGVMLPRLGEPSGAPASTAGAAARATSEQRPIRGERPSRSGATNVEAGPRAAEKKAGAGGVVRIVGIVALVAVGGWLAWSNRASWLPGSAPAAPAPVAAVDPIERAKRLHAEGKTSSALQVLKRIAPGTAEAEMARALIAEWEALEAPNPSGPTPEGLRRQGELLAAAQSAAAGTRFREAHRLYEQAAALLPLPAASLEAAQQAKARADALAPQIAMFKDGSWEEALPTLWRLHEAAPQDRDVTELMATAYVNLAIRELQQESPLEALPNLKEALGVEPADALAKRLQNFAESYREKDPDLQYRIYVKYLPFRS